MLLSQIAFILLQFWKNLGWGIFKSKFGVFAKQIGLASAMQRRTNFYCMMMFFYICQDQPSSTAKSLIDAIMKYSGDLVVNVIDALKHDANSGDETTTLCQTFEIEIIEFMARNLRGEELFFLYEVLVNEGAIESLA